MREIKYRNNGHGRLKISTYSLLVNSLQHLEVGYFSCYLPWREANVSLDALGNPQVPTRVTPRIMDSRNF